MISSKIRIISNIIFGLAFLFLVIVSIFLSTVTNRLNTNDVYDLNDGWTITSDPQNPMITLPSSVDAEPSETITISKSLGNDFRYQQTVLVRGSLASVFVELDGQMIYQKDFEDNVFNTYVSIFHFIEIPENSEGKTLEISVVSPYKNMTGTLNAVYYGSPSGVRDHLLSTHGLEFIIALIWLLTSIIFLVFNLLFYFRKQPKFTYMSLFGLFMSLWILTESRILQLFINNDFLIGSLSYLSMVLAPIAIIGFFKTDILKDDKYSLNTLNILFIVNLFLIIVLHITEVAAFFETAIITQILIAITIVVSVYKIVKGYVDTKSNDFKRYTVIFTIFSVFLLLEIFTYVRRDFDFTSVYASIGMVLVFITILTFNILNIIDRYQNNFQQKIYEEIAHTDQLTKAKSRFAFETDGEDLFYNSDSKLSLVYFDFDNLKYVNDTLGHLKGDEVLFNGFQVINEVFKPYGYSYRIGGDEFACLSIDVTRDKFEHLKNLIHKKIHMLNKNLPYDINISIGYAMKDKNLDKKLSDLVNRADQNMYLDKQKNKK